MLAPASVRDPASASHHDAVDGITALAPQAHREIPHPGVAAIQDDKALEFG
jgi:hypothetical protein